MSKRKRVSENVYEGNYYGNRMVDPNIQNFNNNTQYTNYQQQYPYLNHQYNPYNQINNNNALELLNNIDFNKLNNIISILSDGFDINSMNTFLNRGDEYQGFGCINNTHENIINFFNSLKFIMGNEIGCIIDKFIKFYMDEINSDK